MKIFRLVIFTIILAQSIYGQKAVIASNKAYFPEYGVWEHKSPSDFGLDKATIDLAIQYHLDHEIDKPRSMEQSHYQSFGKEPFGFGIGPFIDRGAPTGIIIHKGYIIAEWGEPDRCDMTHSVTKSFLSSVVGLAVQKGLIRSIQDYVYPYVPPIESYHQTLLQPAELFGQDEMLKPFDTDHNRTITWDHMLRQTSDFEGTLWGKPDWADRPDSDPKKWLNRVRNPSGTTYEYNDVRVNALALAALSVWRKPLPQVLKESIMDPIGASNTWRWAGYRNSWIVLDGQAMQSVSGGGHWGGGMLINAYDMARYGLFTLHNGNWAGKQILEKSWFDKAKTPTTCKPTYGFMNYFLNTNHELLPSAPVSAYYHVGNGTNMVYVDEENDIVMVVRWIDSDAMDGMVKLVLDALPKR